MNKKTIFLIMMLVITILNCSKEEVVSPQNAPIVLILNPHHGAQYSYGDTITFEGVASDSEDGAIRDSTLVWTSDKDGQIGTGLSFKKADLSLNAHVITLTATDSDNNKGSFQVDISIYGIYSPMVSIISPEYQSIYIEGAEILFIGEVIDPEEGLLPDDSLVWASDKDGLIGHGASLTINNLSVNEHCIKLTATDSEGFSDSDSINISVMDSCWIEPNYPKDVFRIIQLGLLSDTACSIEYPLHEDFIFIPRPEDRSNLGDEVFDGWNKEVELAFLAYLEEIYLGERIIQFGDENLIFEREDMSVGRAEFEGNYIMTLYPGGYSEPEVYEGRAIFIIVEGAQGWALLSWEDIDVISSNPTSGYLRGTLRGFL